MRSKTTDIPGSICCRGFKSAFEMTEHEVRKLEAALDLVLPAVYREFLLHPPFAEDSNSYEDLCLYGVDPLIEDNLRFRATTGGNPKLRPSERFLVIGSDHSGLHYVLDLHDAGLPVMEVGFGEAQELFETWPSFAAFLSYSAQADREAAEEDAREAAAPPWPWTKRLVLAAFILAWLAYIAWKAAKAL